MLKAMMEGADGTKLYVFGLSHGNLDRLREGRPILIEGSEIGLEGRVLIFAGETEQSMARELADYIGPDTITKIDPRLQD